MDTRSLRKAAILIDALDSQSADALLSQMGEEQAASVRRAVMELSDVDPQEQDDVIQAFMVSQQPASTPHNSTANSTANNSATHNQTSPSRDAASLRSAETPNWTTPATTRHDDKPFQFLHDANPRIVHSVLHVEHPQTVALVLAHLPPKQAAEIVRLLDQSLRTDVLRRVAGLDVLDVEVLRDVEEEMAVVFSARICETKPSRGLSSLRAILAASQEGHGQDWLQAIEGVDPEMSRRIQSQPARISERNSRPRTLGSIHPTLAQPDPKRDASNSVDPLRRERQIDHRNSLPVRAEASANSSEPAGAKPQAAASKFNAHDGRPDAQDAEVPPPEMSFDELKLLPDAALAMVFRSAPSQISLVALAGAKRPFVERLLIQLPSKDAKSLNQKIEQIGPIQLNDVEFAQRKLAQIAQELGREGQIDLTKSKRFAAAA